jgi:drug/metabolite transporter (DMT)-like permease
VLIGLAGLVALFNPLALDWTDRTVVLGNLAILSGALLWAISILHIRAHRWVSTPFELIPWETLLATLLLVPIALSTTPPAPGDWSPSFVVLLLYLGIVGTAIAYWATATASRHLPAVTTSLGLLATPVVSVITATPGWASHSRSAIIAIVLVLGGWPSEARRAIAPLANSDLLFPLGGVAPRRAAQDEPHRARPESAWAKVQ